MSWRGKDHASGIPQTQSSNKTQAPMITLLTLASNEQWPAISQIWENTVNET